MFSPELLYHLTYGLYIVSAKAGDAESGFYLVRHDFPLDTCQGAMELGAALDVMPEHIAVSACDEELQEFNAASAIFVDTETTGLAGGAGTTAFLIGVGYFLDNVFRLDQCFMRDFDDEEPMLAYLDPLFQRAETIVSFNGKSFDIPLLRTRFIANRLPFRLNSTSHFDLVHAVRRIWKLRLKDCSLGSIERHVLGIHRHDDVPSYEIPQIWFDFLRSRDARDLPRVFSHHRNDILSLVSLTALLAHCIDQPHATTALHHAEDHLSLVRLHFRGKRFEDVIAHAERLLDGDLNATVRRECLDLLAQAAKRTQDWTRMEDAWTLMAREYPNDVAPRLELAKHYEHRTRDLHAACRVCEEALQAIEARASLRSDDGPELWQAQALQHRLDRIRRKLTKNPLLP